MAKDSSDRGSNRTSQISHSTGAHKPRCRSCVDSDHHPAWICHRKHPVLSLVASLGFTTTVIFSLIRAVHYQRQLLKRIARELDAWFVSFQVTVVTIGMCDLAAWQWRQVLPLWTMWIWCHWTVFFDAVPPVTRRGLSYTRGFGLFTSVVLVLYPITLGRTLYIAAPRYRERDRILAHFPFDGVEWKLKLMGFLARELFMLQVWMVRFLWRELLRPTNAFKIIKRRVFFLVPTTQ